MRSAEIPGRGPWAIAVFISSVMRSRTSVCTRARNSARVAGHDAQAATDAPDGTLERQRSAARCRRGRAVRAEAMNSRACGWRTRRLPPQLAPLDLSSCAEEAVGSYCHRPRWSSGPLWVEIVAERGDQRLEVSFGYRTLWAQLLPAKVRRRGRISGRRVVSSAGRCMVGRRGRRAR